MASSRSARDEEPLEKEFNPDSPEEIQSMLMMIDYLLPQARAVSPTVALHLGLARHELARAQAFRQDVITRFPCLQ
jgi:hypothetical protein